MEKRDRLLKEIIDGAADEAVERRRAVESRRKEDSFITVPKYKFVSDGVLSVPAERISSPKVCVDLIRNEIKIQQNHHGEGIEYMVLVLLNPEQYPILAKTIGIGTRNHVSISPPDVFSLVLSPHFTTRAFVLGHNHPSGSITLSDEDRSLLEEYRDLGFRLGRPLRDFVVLGDGTENYYSHRNEAYDI